MGKKARRKSGKSPAFDLPLAAAEAAAAPSPHQSSSDRLLIADCAPLRPWKVAFEPIQLVPRRWNEEIAPFLLTVLTVFLLYTITSPRSVTLEDDGLFLMNLANWGVNHPPGYPLYSLLGSSFYHALPSFIAPALRGHLFSAFCAALACGAIYAIIIQLVRGRLVAILSALALGASDVFWSQAIIAEVYSLNALIYFVILALCLAYASWRTDENDLSAQRKHWALYCAIAFVYGLGLSNHWPLLGLGSIGLLLMVLSQWKTLVHRMPFGLLCLALGVLPYLFVYLRSQTDVALNFYGAVDSIESMRFYVTRGGYSGVDNQVGVGLEEKLAFTLFLANQFLWQFTPAGLMVAGAGFIMMLRSRVHSWLACSLFVAWFMTGPLLVLLIDFQDEFIWFSAFRVYHLLSYGITAIWLGYGFSAMIDYMRPRLPSLATALGVGITTGVLIVATSTAIHWQRNDRSDYVWARDLAMFKLSSVALGTHLFTFDDLDLPVAYMSYVENVRPDVQVYNDQGLVFGNRLYTPFLHDTKKVGVIDDFISKVPSPVYYHPHRRELFGKNHGSDFLGFWRRVNRQGDDERVVLSETLLFWLENALDQSNSITDRWTRQQNFGLIATLILTVTQATQSGYQLDDRWRQVIERAYDENPLAHLVLLSARSTRSDYGTILARKELGDRNLSPTELEGFALRSARNEVAWVEAQLAASEGDITVLDSNNFADMLLIVSQLILRFPDAIDGDPRAYIENNLKRSIDYRYKENNVRFLIDLYRTEKRFDEALELIEREHADLSAAPEFYQRVHAQLKQEKSSGRLQGEVLELPPRT